MSENSSDLSGLMLINDVCVNLSDFLTDGRHQTGQTSDLKPKSLFDQKQNEAKL